jgi:hypothetical protein
MKLSVSIYCCELQCFTECFHEAGELLPTSMLRTPPGHTFGAFTALTIVLRLSCAIVSKYSTYVFLSRLYQLHSVHVARHGIAMRLLC